MVSPARRHFPVALLSDFGYRDHYAGVMKGVIASIAPGASVVDLTHGIPPQSVAAGAIALAQSWRFFPQETIFLAVVDPGVGTKRLPIAVESRAGARFVGPDNGLLWAAAQAAGIKTIVELRTPRYRLKEVSVTFHGRDIFAPAAAWLWRGVRIEALGPRLETMARFEPGGEVRQSERELKGAVIYIDGFGNLVTNISREHVERFACRFRGNRLLVRIGRSAPIEIRKAYGDAPVRAPLATFGSFDMLEVAVRDGNAADYFAAAAGVSVTIRAKRQ
jgi:S-adenosylmethionine hydrolase